MIAANEARDEVKKNVERRDSELIMELNELIKEAIERNEMLIIYVKPLSTNVIKKLKDNGYTVIPKQDVEGTLYVIAWF